MSERHTALRSMHDLGLAAWFGGSLMGALGVNGAAAQLEDSTQRLPVASAGWARWTPVNAAAIGAHLAGAVGELVTESPRVAAQSGVARMSAVKTALTVGALVVTGYSRLLGMKLERAGGPSVEGTTEPNYQTPANVASCQRKMKLLQWAIPALTGSLVVVTAYMSEQQKPGQVFRGLLGRAGGLMSAPMALGKVAAVATPGPKTIGGMAAMGAAKRRLMMAGR
ncbi:MULTISPECIES: hypothetical protein [Micromonospora]|uniref:Uncharacterized protein n=1 Tax=Micromonospora solifontis TaxID=2487138 RepID=A0ABX9WNS3_9ACTN|nr:MULTISPECIES: hypothetical protein [Micromonospora]NES14863.1 hypothetical protein [Micromonospora sp. PPF5-17B]NES35214.1 hypothetical protein [Micromonospora solifontis]NES55209.1 hypothetical protein [Micromonospora sp. PPF5-6]RNM01209.1 hypothetical protein EFE23_03400 [Micromonospora solifontis]